MFELADGMGPFLFAWVTGPLPTPITLDRTATTKVDEMLLIADVAIECSEDIRFRWRKLNVIPDFSKVTIYSRSSTWSGPWDFGCRDTVEVYLVFPEDLLAQGIRDVLVEMDFRSQHNHAIVFALKGAEDTWAQQHHVDTGQADGRDPYSGMTRAAFQIGTWQNYLVTKEEAILGDGQASLVRRKALEQYLGNESSDLAAESKERFLIGTVKIVPGSGTRCQDMRQLNTVVVTAKAKVPLRRVSTGDESLWQ
jgi:hypothetical protein